MPMNKQELLTRDAERDVWQEALEAIQDLKNGNIGDIYQVTATSEVAQARQKTGLSQAKLAQLLGVSLRTLQDWEKGRRMPGGAARTLLKIAIRCPDVVREVLG